MTNQVMLDLETLGNKPGSVIVAIGAVRFNPAEMTIEDEFYGVIDAVSAQAAGLTLDADTVKWWLQQSEPARMAICNRGEPIQSVLLQFSQWLRLPCEEATVWGNGAAFDNTLLAAAYQKTLLQVPWKFWNDRCYRTLKAMAPTVKMARQGTYHNALDDAKSQAVHLMDILKFLKL